MPSTLGFTSHSSQVTDWLRAHVVAFDERQSAPLTNLGTLGPAGDAVATGTRRLVNTGPGAYVWVPGVSGNGLSVPAITGINTANTFQVDFDITPDALTSGATKQIAGSWNASGNQLGWQLSAGTDRLTMSWTSTGAPGAANTSQVLYSTLGFTSGRVRGRMLWRRDNGAGNWDVRWFSLDANGVATLVETDTGVGTSSIHASTQAVEIGGRVNFVTDLFPMIVHRVAISVDGSLTRDIDPSLLTDEGATSWVTTTGQTATISRATGTGYKTEIVLPGSGSRVFNGAESLEVADNAALDFALTDSFSAWALVRQYITPAASNTLIAKGSAFIGAAGYTLGISTVRTAFARISDGTNNSLGAGGTLTNSLAFVGAIRNVSADTLICALDATFGTPGTDGSTATLANSEALRFGRLSGAGTNYFTGRLYAWGIYPGALTAAQWAALRDALLVPQRAAA